MTRRASRNRLGRLRSIDRARERRRDRKAEKKQQDRDGPQFIMPFGKYIGEPILGVRLSYLQWVARTAGHVLQKRAAREIDRRNRVRERARGTT